jgi:hypothetical protein
MTVQNPVTIMDLKGRPSVLIVKIEKCLLFPIARTTADDKQTIMDVIKREQVNNQLDVCINGLWYDLTASGYLEYGNPFDPVVSATEIENEGQVLLVSGTIHGKSAPLGYYGAQRKDLSWEFGFGNLPTGFRAGISGLCPLIIDGLKYGIGNKYENLPEYASPKDAPVMGAPSPQYKQFLVQRNSTKYIALNNQPDGKGKSGFGVARDGTCFVIVQEDKALSGISMEVFRNLFIHLGCHNALACDGSDSVLMYRKMGDGSIGFACKPAQGKIRTMSTALGFKSSESQ